MGLRNLHFVALERTGF